MALRSTTECGRDHVVRESVLALFLIPAMHVHGTVATRRDAFFTVDAINNNVGNGSSNDDCAPRPGLGPKLLD
jgi:hypothetical protein